MLVTGASIWTEKGPNMKHKTILMMTYGGSETSEGFVSHMPQRNTRNRSGLAAFLKSRGPNARKPPAKNSRRPQTQRKPQRPTNNRTVRRGRPVARPRPAPRQRISGPRRALPSLHSYLNPWLYNTSTVKATPHNPYLLVESSTSWNATLAATDGLILVLKHTPTNCKGFAGVFTAAAGLQAYPLIATQLSTLIPTRISMERLGIRVTNTSPLLTVGGSFYALTTSNMPNLNFAADNLGDPYLRLSLADTNDLVTRVKNNPFTKVVTNVSITQKPLTRITAVLKPDFEFSEFMVVDNTNNDSNMDYQAHIGAVDNMDLTSTTILIWPIDGLNRTLGFQMKSQDGCVFDVEHGLYSSCKQAPIVSNVVHSNLHLGAMTTARSGSHDHAIGIVQAAPHEESLVSKIEGAFSFAEQAKDVISSVYNGARRLFSTGSRFASRAAPIVEELETGLPLLSLA